VDSQYRLQDRYERPTGRIHVDGNQALVRLLLEQARRDRRLGRHTGGFVSGYRGSPMGGLDMELNRSARYLDHGDIRFEPGVNEDLAATAIWGTQQAHLLPDRTRDGVFSLWYGKGPGIDRSIDAIKHGNLSGVAPLGGVLVVAGDDPGAKSSSLAHQSEPALISAGLPAVCPGDHADVVRLGLHAWELSRTSGCWVGFKVFTELMDSSSTIDVNLQNLDIRVPADGLDSADYIGWSKPAPMMEVSLAERRLPLAQEFWRLNELDEVHGPADGHLGIIAPGRAYVELLEALERLGLDR
jgi:indolepyruvate ferredoxin oxidoreductase